MVSVLLVVVSHIQKNYVEKLSVFKFLPQFIPLS